MADIFLSYAREDHERAKPIVAALEARGWIVFWDRGILPGPKFRQVLERELTEARCALVLWSNKSVQSLSRTTAKNQVRFVRRLQKSLLMRMQREPIGWMAKMSVRARDRANHADPSVR